MCVAFGDNPSLACLWLPSISDGELSFARSAQVPRRWAGIKPLTGCADHLDADSFGLSMTLDRMGAG